MKHFILHFIRRILFNCLYYFGIIGVFIYWAFKSDALNWQWWVQVLIFSILINVHKDIHKFINQPLNPDETIR